MGKNYREWKERNRKNKKKTKTEYRKLYNTIHEHEKLSASKDYPLVIEKSMTWDSKQYQNLMKYIKKK